MSDQESRARKCTNCLRSIPEAATFCPSCGAVQTPTEPSPAAESPAAGKIKCPKCSKSQALPPPDFCSGCGYPLAPKTGSEIPAQPISQTEDESSHAEISAAVEPIHEPEKEISSSGWRPYPPAADTPPIEPGAEKDIQEPIETSSASNKRKTTLSGLFRIAAAVLVVGIAIGVIWYAVNYQPKGESVEACAPIQPDGKYEEANHLDLEGDLRRDSYFASGQEYTIASGTVFRIPKGRTLIIEPGSRVKFGEGAGMVVEGTLLACGRSSRRILFTANTTTGKPGFWTGLDIRNADPDTVIGHTNFEYGGKDNHAPLWIDGSDVQIENLKFDANLWYPISLDPNSYPTVRPPLVVENGPMGWEIRSGEMTTSQKWDNTQSYIVREILTIHESGSLAISAGTTVKFMPNSAINIKGDFSAIGGSSNPVRFTSYNDGSDEGGLEPKAGDWLGLRFYGREGSSHLEKVEIAYGGQAGGREAGCLWMQDANPKLVSVSLTNCDGFAVSTDIASDPTIEKLSLDRSEILRRWELRGSLLEGSAERILGKWDTVDREPLLPVVQGKLRISESASLKINPGTTVLFAPGDTGLVVEGTLEANGDRRQPVTFTSVRDSAYSREGGARPGDWLGVELTRIPANDTTLSNLLIRYAGGKNSPCLRMESSSPALQNITVRDCGGFAVSSDAASQPLVENLNIQDNTQADLWEIRESTLSEAKTWEWATLQGDNKSTIIRLVTGVVTIEPEASLRLAPGLMLKFTEGKGIYAKGALLIEGTKRDPVVMTSWRDPAGNAQGSPQPGDWGGVVLKDSTSTQISFLEIHYAGSARGQVGCLNMLNSKPSISDLTISNCGYYPISSDLDSNPTVKNLMFENNKPADEWAVRESQLTIGEQRLWEPLTQVINKTPILRSVIGSLTVEDGASLTLAKNVVIKFADGTGLRVRGQLNITGDTREPVIMTSWRDAEFSQEAGAQPGDWTGLVLEGAGSNSILQGFQVRYAGGNQAPRGAVVLVKASPVIKQVKILSSAWYPLSIDPVSNPDLDNISLSNNTPANAVEVRPEGLQTSGETVWLPWQDADGRPLTRVVNGVLNIGPQASLRLSPDIVVKFTEGAGLDVSGNLIAHRAVLTSFYDDQYGGDTAGSSSGVKKWSGIILRGRTLVQVEDTLIRYAQIGMKLFDAAPLLTGLQIEDSWEAALGSDLVSAPQITALQIANNAINGMLILAESLPDGVTRWDVLGGSDTQLVRVIITPLKIGTNSHLVIAPGVIVKFTQQAGIDVEGRLDVGLPGDQRVILTAVSDDRFGGNTDNLSTHVFRGAWTGLRLNPTNTVVGVSLNSTAILYAQTGLEILNPIILEAAELSISESQLYGVMCGIPIQLSLQDEEVDFDNNGQDIVGCIIEQLLEPANSRP